MSCLCTPASFTIIIYLFVNISQPGNDLREVAPGHRLLPHAPLGLHKVEERATGEVLQNVAVETASSCQEALRAVARIHYHRKHQRYTTNMKKNSTLFMFSSCSEIGLRNLSMFEWEIFFTDYILFLGQFCDESNESRYKNGRVWIANGHLIESTLSLL